jgi:SOS-response transcriptional repressor LexA
VEIDIEKLKRIIKKADFTLDTFWEGIFNSEATFFRRLKNNNFSNNELDQIAVKLDIEVTTLFANNDSKKHKEIPAVPFYDVYVTGGAVSQFGDSNNTKVDPSFFITIPHFKDCDIAVKVSGDSMYSKYRKGDIVVCKRIFNKDLIMFGEVFLVVTKDSDYKTIKYIEPCDGDEEHLLLKSENKEGRYKPVKIRKNDIIELYLVRGKVELT